MMRKSIIQGRLSSFPILAIRDFQQQLRDMFTANSRLVSFFGSPSLQANEVYLNAIVANDAYGEFQLLRSVLSRGDSFHSLTPKFPFMHCFERECFEQYGLKPTGHPWPKPIRYPSAQKDRLESYPFYQLKGKEVHEVGVGPIHAGVIEPGHFRFSCYGETIHHLEIQLGFQHRGVEHLLLQKEITHLAPLVETIAGDSSIAHTWAYCSALEALGGTKIPLEIDIVRGIALELERVAMHLAGLAGMSTDIAFLPGASTYGRLRTTAINTSMQLCGSRFGRGWLRPGEVRFQLDEEIIKDFGQALELFKTDLRPINKLFLNSKTVQHRLKDTGYISNHTALEMGFVGMVARSSGLPLDLRTHFPGELYEKLTLDKVVEESGDCWARALLRIREIDESLKWLESAIAILSKSVGASPVNWKVPLEKPAANSIAIAMVEGWRGEVMHCLQTDSSGKLMHYKVQDPSLRNWFALAMAVACADFGSGLPTMTS